MDLEAYSELTEPGVMLVALKSCARRPSRPEDCVEQLGRLLRRARRPAPPEVMSVVRERVAAAFRELCIAGLLDPDEDGRYVLTGRGETVLRENPLGVDSSVLMQFPEYRSRARRPFPFPREEGEDVRIVEPKAEYDDGYVAYGRGLTLTDNPHEYDTAAHLNWQNGWSQARDEATGPGRGR